MSGSRSFSCHTNCRQLLLAIGTDIEFQRNECIHVVVVAGIFVLSFSVAYSERDTLQGSMAAVMAPAKRDRITKCVYEKGDGCFLVSKQGDFGSSRVGGREGNIGK